MSFLKTRKPVMINFTVTGVGNDVTCEKTVDEVFKICEKYKNVIAQIIRSENGEYSCNFLPLAMVGSNSEMKMVYFCSTIDTIGATLMAGKQGDDETFNYTECTYVVE